MLRAGRAGTAILALETAIQVDGETTLPFAPLVMAYEATGDIAGVGRTLQRHLERARGEERADILLRLGDRSATEPGGKESADSHYLDALSLRPLDRRVPL